MTNNKPETSKRRVGPLVSAVLGTVMGAVLLGGCVSNSKTQSDFVLEDPKTNAGALTEDVHEDGLEQLAQLEKELSESKAPETPPTGGSGSAVGAKPDLPVEPTGGTTDLDPPRSIEMGDLPAEASRLIALPKLSPTELAELLSSIELRLGTDHGYQKASPKESASMSPLPEGVTAGPVLSRKEGEGRALLRIAYRKFLSQPAALLVQGMIGQAGEEEANPDVGSVAEVVEELIASGREFQKNLSATDMAYKIIQLSYIDTEGALTALNGFGIKTSSDLSEIELPIPVADLPWVAAMPAPSSEQTGLLGAEREVEKGAFELSVTPSVATPLPTDANTARASQILVYYHPAHPGQFGRVKQLLDEYIDRPTRQIFVEGMVLEISEEGLSELGVEWEFREGSFDAVVGSVAPAGTSLSTANLTFDDAMDLPKNWTIQLKALVRDGKAEVLSRPSVLTLNNRQATIRVGTDIPIATSKQDNGYSPSGQIAFDFKYLATGISLNVMPRANEAGNEVSLLIDTIVSSVVPGAELALRSSSGEVLASAPTIATRRIQTYARINNNTPFIIGGLVNKEHTITRDKIPLLGDIPYLGALFRSEKSSSKKREVIIVLTPHVLPVEDLGSPGRFLPKDEDRFDEFGNLLFRDTYRIRSEDIFDLRFLSENQRLQRYRGLAKRAIGQDLRLAYQEPFLHFANDQIPGEAILVRRMIYEVIKRLAASEDSGKEWLDQQVNPKRLIVFESQQVGGYNVQFMDRLLSRLGDGQEMNSFFSQNPGRALVITFEDNNRSNQPGNLATAPIPKVHVIDCADEAQWKERLWELNQPEEGRGRRHSIVLHEPGDIRRLQRAVLLKKIVALNGGESHMALSNFNLGKVLLMPEAKANQTHLIDSDTARLYFQTENYYGATIQVIESTLAAMDAILKRPEYQWIR
ncbi:MAG: hypothetical protein K9N62_09815 [Verrucomicrobia bacterium]|nr:hypothetical protein [Verrucomicrobiota bacterium]